MTTHAQLLLTIALASATACTLGEEFIQDEELFLALTVEGSTLEGVAREIEQTGATFDRSYETLGVVRLRATEAQLAKLVSQPSLLAVEPVLGVGGDYEPSSNAQMPVIDGTQLTPWGVARVGGPQTSTSRVLWVLDTGVDLDHRDLNIDVARSIDMVEEFGASDDEPNTAHATEVAGIAAAIDNDRDIVGVAPGASVVSVRVLDYRGSGRSDVFIAGLNYAARHAKPDDVVNLSLAASGSSEVIETAVSRAADLGLSIVVAAGNDASDASEFTPAGLSHPGVYTVSAIGQDGCLASFSNYGAAVDLAAPGKDILTLRPGGGLAIADGTSFAAPHVAGLLLAGELSSEGTPCRDRDDVAEPIAHN